jgi:hypothetical protein
MDRYADDDNSPAISGWLLQLQRGKQQKKFSEGHSATTEFITFIGPSLKSLNNKQML